MERLLLIVAVPLVHVKSQQALTARKLYACRYVTYWSSGRSATRNVADSSRRSVHKSEATSVSSRLLLVTTIQQRILFIHCVPRSSARWQSRTFGAVATSTTFGCWDARLLILMPATAEHQILKQMIEQATTPIKTSTPFGIDPASSTK
jgi:hypothetical protein